MFKVVSLQFTYIHETFSRGGRMVSPCRRTTNIITEATKRIIHDNCRHGRWQFLNVKVIRLSQFSPTFPPGHLLVITKGHCRIVCQGCHGTWKTWKKANFFIKSGKILKSQGKKLIKHTSQGKVRKCLFIIYVSVVCIKLLQSCAKIIEKTVKKGLLSLATSNLKLF